MRLKEPFSDGITKLPACCTREWFASSASGAYLYDTSQHVSLPASLFAYYISITSQREVVAADTYEPVEDILSCGEVNEQDIPYSQRSAVRSR